MIEQWLPVPGWEGLYEVSDQGRVRSLDRRTTHTNRNGVKATRPFRGRVLSQFVHQGKDKGYAEVCLHRDCKRKNARVHHLVCEAFHGSRPDGWVTRHLNGIKTDNRAVNLAWGTPQENTADSVRHDVMVRGEGHHQAKLTWDQVDEIRALGDGGTMSHQKIANQFGVARKTISKIIRRQTWIPKKLWARTTSGFPKARCPRSRGGTGIGSQGGGPK